MHAFIGKYCRIHLVHLELQRAVSFVIYDKHPIPSQFFVFFLALRNYVALKRIKKLCCRLKIFNQNLVFNRRITINPLFFVDGFFV